MKKIVLFLVAGMLAYTADNLSAQFSSCDTCEQTEWGMGCVLDGGGYMEDCYQLNPGFCQFHNWCLAEEEEQEAPELAAYGGLLGAASVLGETSQLARRTCDASVMVRSYTVDDQERIKKASRVMAL